MKNFVFQTSHFKSHNPKGFTIIEVAIVVGALSILFALVSVNLLSVRGKTDLNTTYNTVVSDLRTQQIRAMVGEVDAQSSQNYGVFFEGSSYILFAGDSFDSNNPTNIEVELPENLEFVANALPNSEAVFVKGSGELSTYSSPQNSFKLKSTLNGEERTFFLNRLGVVLENEE